MLGGQKHVRGAGDIQGNIGALRRTYPSVNSIFSPFLLVAVEACYFFMRQRLDVVLT